MTVKIFKIRKKRQVLRWPHKRIIYVCCDGHDDYLSLCTYEVLALLFPQTACDCVSLISITGDLINLKAVAVIFQLGT